MRLVPLGGTGVEVSTLGVGTWAMGAGEGGSSGLGPADDADSVAAIHRGLELGMNWVHTAPYYGFGHAERIVARALKGIARRPFVFTMCGLVPSRGGPETHDFRLKAWSIEEEIQASLRRLETDVLDLVFLHWPIPDEDIEEGWQALSAIRTRGDVRFIGVSNFSVDQMDRCAAIAPIDVIQPELSLAVRAAEETVLPYADDHGIGSLIYSPLKHGLLSGRMTRERVAQLTDTDWRRGHAEFSEPRLTRNLAIVEALDDIAASHGCSAAEVAVAWALARPGVTAAITGGRHARQVDEVAGAAAVALSAEDVATLDSVSS